MESDSFAGRMSEMRDSPWLASEDLEDPNGTGYIETTMTIAAVLEVRDAQFKGGRTKAKGYAIQFREIDRMLYLNGVNREKLKEMFGRKAGALVGKTIVLYVNPRVKLMGNIKPGIRIKSHDVPTPTPDELAYIDDTKALIAEAAKMEDLTSIGLILKAKSPAIQAAVRETWAARQAKLKQTGTEALK